MLVVRGAFAVEGSLDVLPRPWPLDRVRVRVRGRRGVLLVADSEVAGGLQHELRRVAVQGPLDVEALTRRNLRGRCSRDGPGRDVIGLVPRMLVMLLVEGV